MRILKKKLFKVYYKHPSSIDNNESECAATNSYGYLWANNLEDAKKQIEFLFVDVQEDILPVFSIE